MSISLLLEKFHFRFFFFLFANFPSSSSSFPFIRLYFSLSFILALVAVALQSFARFTIYFYFFWFRDIRSSVVLVFKRKKIIHTVNLLFYFRFSRSLCLVRGLALNCRFSVVSKWNVKREKPLRQLIKFFIQYTLCEFVSVRPFAIWTRRQSASSTTICVSGRRRHLCPVVLCYSI